MERAVCAEGRWSGRTDDCAPRQPEVKRVRKWGSVPHPLGVADLFDDLGQQESGKLDRAPEARLLD